MLGFVGCQSEAADQRYSSSCKERNDRGYIPLKLETLQVELHMCHKIYFLIIAHMSMIFSSWAIQKRAAS